MNGRIPCRISDGPQTPDDIRINQEPDEDWEYDTWRQKELDEQAEYEEMQQGIETNIPFN